ncbi:hypothetical protein HY988_03105 [Candidatus Micrarchaeota archaeon]|nr:hypothetical protein [Candidatus Micrarchaeota archaeon]
MPVTRGREPRTRRVRPHERGSRKEMDGFHAAIELGGLTSIELKVRLFTMSFRSFIGGTLVELDSHFKEVNKDQIKQMTFDGKELRIRTYSKFDLTYSRDELRSSDTTLASHGGVLYLELLLGIRRYLIAPKRVEISQPTIDLFNPSVTS